MSSKRMTDYQRAMMLLGRWVDPPCLGAHKARELSKDLRGAMRALDRIYAKSPPVARYG